MSKTKRIISILLSAIIVFVSLSFGSINMLAYEDAFIDIDEEKVYANVTVDGHFSDSRVLVMFKNQESLKFKDYQASDFPEINCKSVKDLSSSYAQKVKSKMAEIQTGSILSGYSNKNLETVEISKKYNQTVCLELENVGKENVIAAIKALQKRDDILYVGPDYEMTISDSDEQYEPNDLYYDQQWAPGKIELPKAWQLIEDMSYGEVHEVVVGVLDTGIDGDHPDLNEIIDVSSSRDFTDGSADYVNQVIDDNGHGTHVAGIIGAIGDNDQFIAGTCWNVELVSLKVYGSNGKGYASHLIAAINYARDYTNIQILNFSGVFTGTEKDGNGNYWLTPNDIFPLQNAIDSFGGLFVCAAGNSNNNNDNSSRYPASFVIDNMITVGASDNQDQKRFDSNYGYSTVDLFAPGDNIYSLWNEGNCRSESGTSMAAPFVTGVAAIILSIYPDLTQDITKVKGYIVDNVDGALSGVSDFTWICDSGGRLNAFKAVQAAIQDNTPALPEACQHDGEVYYNQYNDSSHRVKCYDCDEVLYTEEHEGYNTNYGSSGHRFYCNICGYYKMHDHDLYISAVYNDVYTIKCRGCTYVKNCNCDREYVSDGSSGHYYNCLEGCFSEFESHTYELTGEYDNYDHEVECIYCNYSEYVDHDLYMYSAAPEDYVVKCHDCTYSIECWESPEYYGDSDDGHWMDCPDGCYSFFEPHTPGAYGNTGEGYHEIECADCGYVYAEDCNYGSAENINSNYHCFECVDCGYEHTESHVFVYSQIANDIYAHNAYCRVCQQPYSKPHNWVSRGSGYECLVCGMTTTVLPDYSSLSNDELSLLLSSMSEEELAEFIASLPEDALGRVTAILTPVNDDELLTE